VRPSGDHSTEFTPELRRFKDLSSTKDSTRISALALSNVGSKIIEIEANPITNTITNNRLFLI
jgi:hypothetical protein